MSKITIDLSKFTPEQAFELGKMFNVVLESKPKSETIISRRTSKRTKRVVTGENKFKKSTHVSEWIVSESVAKRQLGQTFPEIAEWLNGLGLKTKTGLQHTEQSAWAIVYSIEAQKYWSNK